MTKLVAFMKFLLAGKLINVVLKRYVGKAFQTDSFREITQDSNVSGLPIMAAVAMWAFK